MRPKQILAQSAEAEKYDDSISAEGQGPSPHQPVSWIWHCTTSDDEAPVVESGGI